MATPGAAADWQLWRPVPGAWTTAATAVVAAGGIQLNGTVFFGTETLIRYLGIGGQAVSVDGTVLQPFGPLTIPVP